MARRPLAAGWMMAGMTGPPLVQMTEWNSPKSASQLRYAPADSNHCINFLIRCLNAAQM